MLFLLLLGKGPCDQAASAIKRRVLAYVDEGHNAVTALQLAEAAHSHGGIKGVTTIVVGALMESKPQGFQQPKILSINLLSNFEFQSNGAVKAWKAYNVGSGIELRLQNNSWTYSWIDKTALGYKVYSSTQSGWIPMKDQLHETCLRVPNNKDKDEPLTEEDVLAQDMDLDVSEFDQKDVASCLRLFQCPAENCIKSFNRYGTLFHHIALGWLHYYFIHFIELHFY